MTGAGKPSLTLLYPLYEIGQAVVSNSYAVGGTLLTRADPMGSGYGL